MTTGTTPLTILLAGLPGSGNTLARQHCRRSGCVAHVDHGKTAGEFFRWVDRSDGVIVPWRLDQEARRASAMRRGGGFSLEEEYRFQWSKQVSSITKPIVWVCFEDILETNGAALDKAMRSIGIEPAEWPRDKHSTSIANGRVLSEEERSEYRARMIAQGIKNE